MNATHRVTLFSSVFSLLTQFSGNLQWDTSERKEAYGDKGNILRWKLESSSVRNFLVMCEFISQNYTYVSCSFPLTLSLRILRRTYLDRIEAYDGKGISPVQNVKEASWETSLWSVNSSPRVTVYFSGRSLLTLFSWNLQSEIWEPLGAHGEKGNNLR